MNRSTAAASTPTSSPTHTRHTSYLIWKNDGNRIGDATGIWSAQLAPDLQSVAALPPSSSQPSQPWQGSIVEGPDMVRRHRERTGGSGGTLLPLLLRRCNTAPPPMASDGPAVQWPERRLHRRPASGLAGLGSGRVRAGRTRRLHAAADARISTGQTVMAFAGWQGDTIGYLACGIRPMYLADLTFFGAHRRHSDADAPTPPVARPPPPVRPAPSRRHPRLDTGRSPPTAASSPSVPRASTARPDPSG